MRRGLLAAALAATLIGTAQVAAGGQIYPRLPPGQTSYGGPFRLTDHHGSLFTQDELRGHFTLLYFGYTDCADVCPSALYTIARALDALGAQGEGVEPVFVNLDATRGSLERLGRYVGYFHPRMRGLTGSAADIAAAAAAWRVHYFHSGEGADARLEHSGSIFLIGPDGVLITFLPHGTESEDITATVRHHMATPP